MDVSPRSTHPFDWELVTNEPQKDEEEYEFVDLINTRITASKIDEKFHQLITEYFTAAKAQKIYDEPVQNQSLFPSDLIELFGQEEFLKIPHIDLGQKEITEIRVEDLKYRCMRFSNSNQGHSGVIFGADNQQNITLFSGPIDSVASWEITLLPWEYRYKESTSLLLEIFSAEIFDKIPVLDLKDRQVTQIKEEDFTKGNIFRFENSKEKHVGVAFLIKSNIEVYRGPNASGENWMFNTLNDKKIQKAKTHIQTLQSQISAKSRGEKRNNLNHLKDEAEQRLEALLKPIPISLAAKKGEMLELYSQVKRD